MGESVFARCGACGDLLEVEVEREAGALQLLASRCPSCGAPLQVEVRHDEWGDPEVVVAPR